MTDRANYILASNAVYKVLENYNGKLPQIDIFEIIKDYKNIRLFTYAEAANKQKCTFSHFIQSIPSAYGFTISDKNSNKHLVFYNDFKDDTTIRFTLAHELGHIILQHDEDNDISNKEANCFARNLLCPIPIAREFNLRTVEDYVSCFQVSEPMAEVSLDYKSVDFNNISQYNYQMLEDKVYEYFWGYTLPELYGAQIS